MEAPQSAEELTRDFRASKIDKTQIEQTVYLTLSSPHRKRRKFACLNSVRPCGKLLFMEMLEKFGLPDSGECKAKRKLKGGKSSFRQCSREIPEWVKNNIEFSHAFIEGYLNGQSTASQFHPSYPHRPLNPLTLELGQCLVTGALVDYPLVVNVRDIVTPRAKESNFEKLLGVYIPPVPIDEIPKPLEETPSGLNVFSTPGKPNIQTVTSGASVNVLVKCPDCGKPMIPKKGRYYCQTNNCNVIMATPDGHITRAAAPTISRPRPPS